MTAKRPVIGINANYSPDDVETPSISIRANYIDSITSAGGVPLLLPPIADLSLIPEMADHCDGFIFIGGPDIDPARYGEERHPAHKDLSTRREEFDFALMKEVMSRRKPMLAICLGHQELNVALGGTLIQDIATQTSSTIGHSRNPPGFGEHDVVVEEGTRLHSIVSTTTMEVNTSHHQSIKKVGQGLKISSRSSDGIIESIELENYPFCMGLQWHPERLTDQKEHLGIFEALVESAREQRDHQESVAKPEEAGLVAK